MWIKFILYLYFLCFSVKHSRKYILIVVQYSSVSLVRELGAGAAPEDSWQRRLRVLTRHQLYSDLGRSTYIKMVLVEVF